MSRSPSGRPGPADNPEAPPGPGAAAPQIALCNQFGETIELAAAAGGPTLVMFYPFAFSRICGAELTEVHRRWPEFHQMRTRLLAISCDAVHTLRAYAEELREAGAAGSTPDLHLLSDFWPHGAAAQRYGAFNRETGAAHRVSFLVDEQLNIAHIVTSEDGEARSLDHTLELLRSM